jgi:hypothetical protein
VGLSGVCRLARISSQNTFDGLSEMGGKLISVCALGYVTAPLGLDGG